MTGGGEATRKAPETRSLFVFQLGEAWFAVATEQVETVVANGLPLTLVPTAPAHIEGVVNHRGKALAVFDAGVFLGQEVVGEAPRLLVVAAGGKSAALPVRTIRGILEQEEEGLRPAEAGMPHAVQIFDLEVGVVQVLDLAALLEAASARGA